MFVLQIKYKSFLNVYLLCKQKNKKKNMFLIIKSKLVKISLLNSVIWFLKLCKHPICVIPYTSSSQNVNELLE